MFEQEIAKKMMATTIPAEHQALGRYGQDCGYREMSMVTSDSLMQESKRFRSKKVG